MFGRRGTYVASTGQIAASVLASAGGTVGSFMYFPTTPASTIQGTWTQSVDATNWFCYEKYNSSHANGDGQTFDIYLGAGTWTLSMTNKKQPNAAIVLVKIDGTTVATFDQYAAGGVTNQTFTQAGIVVASSGQKVMTIIVSGKNAASSDYYCYLDVIQWTRTA